MGAQGPRSVLKSRVKVGEFKRGRHSSPHVERGARAYNEDLGAEQSP